MIIYLYGLPAVGKNFIGELLKERYGFYFQDADKYLPKEMKLIENTKRKKKHNNT